MAEILMVTSGWIHPPHGGRVALRETLAELDDLSFEEVGTLEEALQRPLSRYAAMVLYYHHPSRALSEIELTAFRNYVEGGGGVLAIHSATASYKSSLPYFEVLGGRFIGHGPVTDIDIRPSTPSDDLFGGITAFQVKDELYLHEQQPDLRVHFDAEHDGEVVPVVWTRQPAQGRICYVCPGHRAASMRHPSIQEILRRALSWVANLRA